MITELAPIAISTYSRLEHLKQTVSALQKNALAVDSDLYIFSDAPKSGDEDKVNQLRQYLHTISGFKNVYIYKREINSRIANNRGGMKMLLEQFGKIIFLEEDVITAPGFLVFMNEALSVYENNKQIFSIAGYCPPIEIPQDYEHDAFFLKRFNAWGFGIWKDRFESINYISREAYEKLIENVGQLKEFSRAGEDMIHMLKADVYKEIDALDVKAMYAQFISNQYTVYPTLSLTQNSGMDGSGTHCGKTGRFNVSISQKQSFKLPVEVFENDKIYKANRKFRANGLLSRLYRKIFT